jgi:glycosyltransferase involved in cell wall biosynthesis
MTRITGVILTLNEARHVRACIESLHWTDRVLVFDSHSTDETVELARRAGADVVQHPFENYSQQRNAALDAAQPTDWVLFVDADERATDDVAEEIRSVTAQERPEVGWWIPRHNYIFGHRMRGAGWWPDTQLRLLRPDHAHYDEQRAVHEEAILDGPAGELAAPLVHYNYETLAQFHTKQRRYTDFDAQILQESGARPRVYTPYTQCLRHFWWRFVTLSGWRDGPYGILLSGLMAYYELVKYRKVRRLQRAEGQGDG